MIDETSAEWMFNEEEGGVAAEGARAAAVGDGVAAQVDAGVLMGFLSEFRSAVREQAAAERGAAARRREPAGSRLDRPAEPEPWELDPYVGSEKQVTPEWWFADDGRWYPPELHPDCQVPVEPVQEVREPVSEPIVEAVPNVAPVGQDNPGRKPFLLRGRRQPGGLALEL